MSSSITFEELASTAIKATVGERTFKADLQTSSTDDNGIVSWIWNGITQLGGFLINEAVKLVGFTVSGIWGLIVSAVQFVYNFNFNATDQELNLQMLAKFNSILTRFGGVLGKSFGYLACGVLPGAVIAVFNEPLAASILKDVASEYSEEIISDLADLTQLIFRASIEVSLIWIYQNLRKMIKSSSPLIGRLFGEDKKKLIDAWGQPGSQPWSFAQTVENAVESIPNETLRGFVEEFLEEAWEGCVEAGYVVAGGIESYLAGQKLANEVASPLGEMRYVELQPDRNNPDERIVLAGSEQLIKTQIVQTLSTHQQIRERDIGVVYGTPPEAFPERRYKPEVVLKFYQEKTDRKPGEKPITMQISFRLMNKSKDNFKDDTYAQQLAAKIHAKFAKPPFKIKKGNIPFSYADHEKGYQLLLWVDSLAQARRVVDQVLDIQGHSVDNSKLKKASVNAVTNSVPTIGEKVIVLGETTQLPVNGKPGIVTFTSAYINPGMAVKPITLIDLKKRKRQIYKEPVNGTAS